MEPLTDEQIQWLEWCHADSELYLTNHTIQSVARMVRFSSFQSPLLFEEEVGNGYRCAGYLVLCQGEFGVVGNIRYVSESPHSGHSSVHESNALTRVLKRLCERALGAGAEIVQAIMPIEGHSVDPVRRLAFENAGLDFVATLIQMECEDILSRAALVLASQTGEAHANAESQPSAGSNTTERMKPEDIEIEHFERLAELVPTHRKNLRANAGCPRVKRDTYHRENSAWLCNRTHMAAESLVSNQPPGRTDRLSIDYTICRVDVRIDVCGTNTRLPPQGNWTLCHAVHPGMDARE
jgi:hypothetical protein